MVTIAQHQTATPLLFRLPVEMRLLPVVRATVTPVTRLLPGGAATLPSGPGGGGFFRKEDTFTWDPYPPWGYAKELGAWCKVKGFPISSNFLFLIYVKAFVVGHLLGRACPAMGLLCALHGSSRCRVIHDDHLPS